MRGAFIIVFLLIPFSLLFWACKKQGPTQDHSNFTEHDSLKRLKIEAVVNNINDTVTAQGLPVKVAFPVFNPHDTIEYWTVEGKPARISVSLNYPDKVVWPTFFIDQDKLVLVRYRFWSNGDAPYVRETFTYLHDNEIVYCMERKMDLPEDGLPLYLREMPFADCERTEDDIRKDYESLFGTIYTYLQENISNQ